MDYVRVGGVCLLLMVIAAALPVNVLAQTPQASANGAAPIISQSLASESQAQGETISAETLAKRNTGLKPLGTRSSRTASGAQTTGQSQTPVSAAPATTSAVAATAATAHAIHTELFHGNSDAIQLAGIIHPSGDRQRSCREATVTPDQIAQETATTQALGAQPQVKMQLLRAQRLRLRIM